MRLLKDILKQTKHAFLDYDRTLFVHAYPYPGDNERSYADECYAEYIMQQSIHCEDTPLICMQWFVNMLMQEDIPCTVLSHEIFNLRDEYKKSMALAHYGIDSYITTDSSEHKIEMIRAVAKANGIVPAQCLLVDDKMDTIYRACAAGMIGLHLSNVVLMHEQTLL